MARLFCLRLIAALVVASLWTSCGREAAEAPLAVDDIPTALNSAFESAPENLKQLADKVVTALKNQNFAAAYRDLETLKLTSDLSAEQRAAVERAMLTFAF